MLDKMKMYVNPETCKDIVAIAAIGYTLIKAVEGWKRKRLTDIVFPMIVHNDIPEV